MDPNKLPPLGKVQDVAAMGDRKITGRVLITALLAAAALATASLNSAPDAPIQQAQAKVVAKVIMHDGVALEDRGANAWQQAEDGLQAKHNLVLELDGRNAVVSVSPEVFDSVCKHITPETAALWNGSLGCGTMHGPGDAPPLVEIDHLDRVAVDVSVNANNELVIHGLEGTKPAADGFLDRLNLKRDLAPKSGKFSI